MVRRRYVADHRADADLREQAMVCLETCLRFRGVSLRPSGPATPGPEPQKSSKKYPKGCSGASGPGGPQSPQRVRPRVRKESKKVQEAAFFGLFFGLCGALFGDSGAPRGGTPFRTLFGLFWGRARETSVPGRGVPNPRDALKWRRGSEYSVSTGLHLKSLRAGRVADCFTPKDPLVDHLAFSALLLSKT